MANKASLIIILTVLGFVPLLESQQAPEANLKEEAKAVETQGNDEKTTPALEVAAESNASDSELAEFSVLEAFLAEYEAMKRSSCSTRHMACCGSCSISCNGTATCVAGAFRWDVNGRCRCTRLPRCTCG